MLLSYPCGQQTGSVAAAGHRQACSDRWAALGNPISAAMLSAPAEPTVVLTQTTQIWSLVKLTCVPMLAGPSSLPPQPPRGPTPA